MHLRSYEQNTAGMLYQLTPAQMKEINSFHRGLRLESVTPISAIHVPDQVGDEVSPFATITPVMAEWVFRILSPLEGGVKKILKIRKMH